jgi:hypothetical protein
LFETGEESFAHKHAASIRFLRRSTDREFINLAARRETYLRPKVRKRPPRNRAETFRIFESKSVLEAEGNPCVIPIAWRGPLHLEFGQKDIDDDGYFLPAPIASER